MNYFARNRWGSCKIFYNNTQRRRKVVNQICQLEFLFLAVKYGHGVLKNRLNGFVNVDKSNNFIISRLMGL